MAYREGIRDCMGDVYVQAGEIASGAITAVNLGDCSTTTNKLGNCAVTTAKLGDCSVTTAKLAMSVGAWSAGLLSTAGLTVAFTWIATNACTITDCIIQITAAASAGLIGVASTAPISFFTASITLETTYRNNVLTCAGGTVTSGTTIVVELTAGGSLIGAISGATTAHSGRGKYFLHYIATPV